MLKLNLSGNKPSSSKETPSAEIPAKPQREKIVIADPTPESKAEIAPKKSGFTLSLDQAKLRKSAAEEEKKVQTLSPEAISFPKDFYEISDFDAEKFEENAVSLAMKLQDNDPDIKTYLMAIYQNLRQYPELSHLLTDEQIGLIVEGFKQFKDIEIKTTKPKKETSIKKMEKITMEDAMNLEF